MRFSRLRDRLVWLFFSFFLLVSVSAAITFWALAAHRQDALLVNLAGRQRMLVQQMTRAALDLSRTGEAVAPTSLQDARTLFAQTLAALRHGGEVMQATGEAGPIRAASAPQLQAQLDRVALAWDEYSAELDRLLLSRPGSAERLASAAAIDRLSPRLLAEAESAVRLYQEAATRKVNRLRAMQAAFLACALLLLLVGGWMVRHSVLRPLQQLDLAAERIGAHDLSTPVLVAGPDEITLLSGTLESMRARLQASHTQLLQLTADLEDRVAQRTRELEALNQVSREISSQLDLQLVLDSVTEKAHSLLGADVASLCLIDEEGEWLHLAALSGPGAAIVEQRIPAGQNFVLGVLAGEGAAVCGHGQCAGGCQMLAPSYRASHLVAPLRHGRRVIGALCVGSPQQGRFAVEAGAMLAKLANTAAIALENARLYAQAERVAALEERSRIAAEMHDGLGQTLSYLGLMTDQVVDFLAAGQDEAALQRLQATRATIGRATDEVRRAIDHLLDEAPLAPDLAARLQLLAGDFERQHGLIVRWQPGAEAQPLTACSGEVAEQVLHITREALHNAARHAAAQAVVVRLERVNGHYALAVEDDGRGFDPSAPEPAGHFGLKIMQARAAHIGGSLQVESAFGQGTQVRLVWPAAGGGG